MGWRKEERPALGSGMQEASGEARLWGQGKGPHCTAGRREAGFCSPTVCPGQGAPAEVLQTCLVSPFQSLFPKGQLNSCGHLPHPLFCMSLSVSPTSTLTMPPRTCPSPLPLPQCLPLAAARSTIPGNDHEVLPTGCAGSACILQLAEQIGPCWLRSHSWVCCRVLGSHGHALKQGEPTHTSVGEPQARHAGARTGVAPAEQEAPQETADGPGRGGHGGGPRTPHCL